MGESRFVVTAGSHVHAVEVEEGLEGRLRVRIDRDWGDRGDWIDVDVRVPAEGTYSLLIEGRSYLVDVTPAGGDLVVAVGGETHRVRLEDPRRGRAGPAVGGPAGSQRLVAPMPGKVVAVHVIPGQRVEPGAPLLVLEAMKMENEFRATVSGQVAEVRVTAGQPVNAGDLLVVIA